MVEVKTLAGAKRRIEQLEALLEAEREEHAKTSEYCRDHLRNSVDFKLRIDGAIAMLEGKFDV